MFFSSTFVSFFVSEVELSQSLSIVVIRTHIMSFLGLAKALRTIYALENKLLLHTLRKTIRYLFSLASHLNEKFQVDVRTVYIINFFTLRLFLPIRYEGLLYAMQLAFLYINK